jgi:hypothetical protein
MEQICALCREPALLKNSHYLPAAAYRPLRRDNQPPTLIDFQRNVSVQTSTQLRKHLLCADCEKLFDSKGEDTVFKAFAAHASRFPLRERLLKSSESRHRFDGYNYHPGHLLPDLKLADFTYFAASVLWRGSVTKWSPTTAPYFGALGAYQEAFRLYLLGKVSLPDTVALDVYVECGETPGLAWPPAFHKEREPGGGVVYRHTFMVPGLKFVTHIGGPIRHQAIARHGAPLFIEWDFSRSDTKRRIQFDLQSCVDK